MLYFAILGKTPQLSLAELQGVGVQNIKRKGKMVIFELDGMKSDEPFDKKLRVTNEVRGKKLFQLAGIIKRGKVVTFGNNDFLKAVKDLSLVGVNERSLGMTLKKEWGARRFKEIELEKSDLEIKEQGKELVDLSIFSIFGDDLVGIVTGRQDIKRFEVMDFEKPVRSMEIGMMPAKLTQVMVNLGIKERRAKSEEGRIPTICDPFCGLGTTGFVANSLGYHFIGSDINITPAKQNKKWWIETAYAQNDKFFTLFKHDVNDAFTKPFLKQVDVIVSEGRLGPILKEKNHLNKEQQYKMMMSNIDLIVALYTVFLKNAKIPFAGVPMIITVPVYLALPAPFIEERITESAKKLGYEVEAIGEVYKRKKQNVGRRVLKMKY